MVALAVILTPSPMMAQQPTNFGSASGVGCPNGNVICNGSINFLTQELFFEPEVPAQSLKKGPPTWNEIEQLMDNPYAVTTGAACNDASGAIPGNDQGYPTYCTNGLFIRRLSLGGVTLPPLLVHPLNYNAAIGSEMRLLNPNFRGGLFNNTGVCFATGGSCTPQGSTITVSSGGSRVEETEIDYDIAIGRKLGFCQINPEPVPLDAPNNTAFDSETLTACGSDPGEPGAFSRAFPGGDLLEDNVGLPINANNNTTWYSTPAVPAPNALTGLLFQTPHGSIPGVPTGTAIPITGSAFRLVDPTRSPSTIQPRQLISGEGGLRKPSLRVPAVTGNGINPNYLWNSVANLTARGQETLQPSNENDYVGLFPSTGVTPANYRARKEAARGEAAALGKALFWDMQVGSDAVQSCGSCHAHAGADNRTKNQINPNHLGGDTSFDIPVNTDVTAANFPLHRLSDPEIAGDPLCTSDISANVTGITFPDGDPPDHPLANPTPVVCAAGNLVSDTNDVLSSQGVHFGRFLDIPPIGTFGTPSAIGNVASVVPDLRVPVDFSDQATFDPIAGFGGASGFDIRRVEPRNTPTIFLADVNFDNFWDGRARHDDNAGSVFGPSDPQAHVFVNDGGTLVPTRQLIKFSSLASLAKGPALSEFEMSFQGRNWAKIGKKLLQAGVTPLANQLVATSDSLLGRYSNQGGSDCASVALADRSASWSSAGVANKPGLCISYAGLIRRAFYPALHNNPSQHLNGCYTDGRPEHTGTPYGDQCSGLGPITILEHPTPAVDVLNETTNFADPFDGYRLTVAPGPANATNTNQFTHMEANFSLFFGQSIHIWASLLVPDDTPFDRFLDQNPDAGSFSTGESGEPLLVLDLPNCPAPAGYVRDSLHGACFREVGNFKRDSVPDPNIPTAGTACINETTIAGVRTCTNRLTGQVGTRGPNAPDPLLGMDLFFGSNVSLKNPNFRAARCGECHAPPTLTDHTLPFTVKAMLVDLLPEFERGNPVVEPLMEPLGHSRVISGFLLESELNEPGQDAIERRVINQSIAPAPVVANNGNCTTANCSGYAFPDGITNASQGCAGPNSEVVGGACIHHDLGSGPIAGAGIPTRFTGFGGALFDNGMYNIGVRPCIADQVQVTGACEDNGRGNTDAFGWPLSLAALMLKDLGGPVQHPGSPIPATLPDGNPGFNPNVDAECAPSCLTGGLFPETAHDQQINPGFEDEPKNPQLPAYLAPFANKITVGDAHPGLDEACGAIGACPNTLMDVANAEGFPEIPFDPRSFMTEVLNKATAPGAGAADFASGQAEGGEAAMGTWPVVNRVGRFGSFKAPQLREVELTGPYFHNGGKLTLRQVVDFYTRGGDFPVTNSQHRDFNILNLNAELQSNLSENEKVALVDFLIELTDPRVRNEAAPFDHPEMIVPLDGTAPENNFGRDGFGVTAACTDASQFGPGQRSCLNGMFLDIPATGAAGGDPIPNFLGIASGPRLVGAAANCGVANNQYCH
jgi:cytochrome c peroxidase